VSTGLVLWEVVGSFRAARYWTLSPSARGSRILGRAQASVRGGEGEEGGLAYRWHERMAESYMLIGALMD
jgi:hypothetical protein